MNGIYRFDMATFKKFQDSENPIMIAYVSDRYFVPQLIRKKIHGLTIHGSMEIHDLAT